MALIQIFARPPVEGKVKTRLMAVTGPEAATKVYLHCLRYTIELIKSLKNPVQLWLSEEGNHPYFSGLEKLQQTGKIWESACIKLCLLG